MEKQTLLNNDNIIKGVTYFKLVSDLEGDYTKNCGLLGEEIDRNFYFLRGYDIDNIYVDNDRNIIIKRVDDIYNPMKINLDESFNLFDINLDKKTGSITFKYPNGEEKVIDGFVINNGDINFITDGSIEGKGTINNPLKLASVNKTGMYAPVNEYIDLTSGQKLPTKVENGYRIITKENLNIFGKLYSLSGMKDIEHRLETENYQWRIPTKDDWDELLNALEINEIYRNHNTEGEDVLLGEVAGIALKSSKIWKEHPTNETEVPVEGQNILGLSIFPLGIGSKEIVEGFGEVSGMWTNSSAKTGDYYVKLFRYDTAKVEQNLSNNTKMSIRLVKDFDGNNYNEIETILGQLYPTKLVHRICNDNEYVKIWTTINVYDTLNIDGIISDEWNNINVNENINEKYFFINEWDGYQWKKKLLNEGDSIIIINHENKPYNEWRVIGNELIDAFKIVYDKINEESNRAKEVEEKLATSISDTKYEAEGYTRYFTMRHVAKELKPYAKTEYVEDLIVNLEGGNIDLGGYVKTRTLESALTETINDVNNYTNDEIKKLSEVYAPKKSFETLVGKDDNKSARKIAAEEVAKVVASADSSFDTLKEIADYIANDIKSAATIVNNINELEEKDKDIYSKLATLRENIANLGEEIKKLQEQIKDINNQTVNEVKEIVKNYIIVTDNEIKKEEIEVINNDGEIETKLKIGFADDAIFG